MKLKLGTITLTVTPEELNKALREHGYELLDKRPEEERPSAHHRFVKDLRSVTFMDNRQMSVYEAFSILIPEALRWLIGDSMETKAASHAAANRINSKGLYTYIHQVRGGLITKQFTSPVNIGKQLTAMAEESPVLTFTVHGGATFYKWMPNDSKWTAGGMFDLEPGEEPDELYLAQRAALEGEIYLPPDLRNRRAWLESQNKGRGRPRKERPSLEEVAETTKFFS